MQHIRQSKQKENEEEEDIEKLENEGETFVESDLESFNPSEFDMNEFEEYSVNSQKKIISLMKQKHQELRFAFKNSFTFFFLSNLFLSFFVSYFIGYTPFTHSPATLRNLGDGEGGGWGRSDLGNSESSDQFSVRQLQRMTQTGTLIRKMRKAQDLHEKSKMKRGGLVLFY